MKIIKSFIIILFPILIFSKQLYSQKIESFSISSCDKSIGDLDFVNERIADYEHISDTLKIIFDLVENCALNPMPTLEIEKDTLSIKLNHTSNIVDMCDCCFELRFIISDVKYNDFSTVHVDNKTLKQKENKFILLPDEYPIFDTTAFNQISNSGIKIGLWREEHTEKSIEVLSFYEIIDNENDLLWRKIYDIDKKELKRVSIKIRNNVILELTGQQYEEILNNRP